MMYKTMIIMIINNELCEYCDYNYIGESNGHYDA